ncbi:S8 family peptidase [Desmospora activa]|uniref:Thermitase n=1 Tax=Desmospora activa DSM 45169 TaxID=1121389 RepID=A0A2T4ZAA7_9BACL|nr:S8 family peptidase [Desmospora activa]PTM58824.1 thermitase [Desmospora activa DSM 45169]
MKRELWALFLVFLLITSLSISLWSPTTVESATSESIEKRLIVKYKTKTSENVRQSLVRKRGDQIILESHQLDFLVVEIPEGESSSLAVEQYRKHPDVEYVELDRPGNVDIVTNDLSTPQWNRQKVKAFLPNDPLFSTYQWGLQKIKAPEAWDLTMGSSDVTIAVVDSGVQDDHPDLEGRVIKGYDFVENDWDPQDEYGHGTHIAGIAAATTNNGIGIAGIAPHSKILSVRIFKNETDSGYTSYFAQGIIHAADQGADVITCSFGINEHSPTLEAAVLYAWEKGAVVIGSAGNNPTSKPRYPAAYKPAISVANTDSNDEKAESSNFGEWVDIAAPGTDIISTIIGSQYYEVSGTSMSVPHVAGVAALLASEGYNNEEIRHIIMETADKIPGTGTLWTSGRLNAERAVRYAQ